MQPTERHRNQGASMVFREGVLLKPTKPKAGGACELEWYERVSSESSPFLPFLPRFLGREEIDGLPYIRMENVLSGLSRPSQIDLKLGRRTYPLGASQEKIDYELWKYPRQSESGYRMAGVRYYDRSSGLERSVTKRECQSYSPERLPTLLRLFLGTSVAGSDATALVGAILKRLDPLIALFRSQTSYHFTASSVLIVYDGSPSSADPRVEVRFIDFFYAIPGEGAVDENTLFGLERVREDLLVASKPEV